MVDPSVYTKNKTQPLINSKGKLEQSRKVNTPQKAIIEQKTNFGIENSPEAKVSQDTQQQGLEKEPAISKPSPAINPYISKFTFTG